MLKDKVLFECKAELRKDLVENLGLSLFSVNTTIY